ncbi:hypothetical protein [Paenibacillus sp. N3.4]|uniref:hypothetical protein n=1 Tax=Paenibacillus sp. N3.4 TaxID=2603222 RepID=UPI0011CB48DD|nr:hypothetical protein [Paenibacillus sp. N3.4]TXK83954.1 hypothetical protein FU659_10880 [Paenibacillus sp. N3.4]
MISKNASIAEVSVTWRFFEWRGIGGAIEVIFLLITRDYGIKDPSTLVPALIVFIFISITFLGMVYIAKLLVKEITSTREAVEALLNQQVQEKERLISNMQATHTYSESTNILISHTSETTTLTSLGKAQIEQLSSSLIEFKQYVETFCCCCH